MALATFALSISAEIITVNTPLKSQEIYKVVKASAENFLRYDTSDLISGGLYGELENPTIVEITKENKQVTHLKVEYSAFFMTVDFDFGDPVHEEFTKCTSNLTKGKNGNYSIDLTKTTCNYDPQLEIGDYDSYDQNQDPCCDNGRPVVDSNWCFDSYQEGAAYCASR